MNERRTERLLMRRWRDGDRPAFAAMNADPAVMEYFASTSDRRESDAVVDRIEAHFDARGFGLWAVEIPGLVPFIGFVGLWTPSFEAHFTPAVEVGWRLAREHDELGLEEIVAFTVPANFRSRRVMEHLGMTHDTADDFDHPGMPEGHALRRHVLYRLGRPDSGESSPPAA